MYLGKADVNTYDKGAGREFLVSSRGSYGFSTVIGANTRREHGLLVVRPEGAAQHSVLVSKIEETILDSNKKYQLSTNRYKDLVYPDGYRYLQEYQGNPFPSMLFVIHSILLKKSIFMPQNEICTVLKYELIAAPNKIRLDLRPIFAHRFNSDVSTKQDGQDFVVSLQDSALVGIEGRDRKSYCMVTSGTWQMKPLWFENIIYEQDDKPESQSIDNLWSFGFVTNEISQGDVVYVVLSDKPVSFTIDELNEMEKDAVRRFENILEQANLPALTSAEQDMIHASYHLTDDRKDMTSPIYTGYPSVASKTRDTFVALPGLTLATGRESAALRVLNFWIDKAKESGWIMPESLLSDGTLFMGGVDCGLWFVYAADKYISHMGPDGDYTELCQAILKIVDRYFDSIPELDTEYAENGLLYLTDDKKPRHWMYFMAGDELVVSRKGYLVEVNALWYNALKIAEKCAAEPEKYAKAAKLCAESFRSVFWCSEINGLYDFVDENSSKKEVSIRPNQVLAASLPYTPLTDEMGHKVVNLAWNELYTTYGLRTLDPHHEKFKGRSEGRLDQRLKARYRGMAWPWLLGQFITAYLRYNPTRTDLGWIFIRPFHSHLRHGCLGGISETFDGIMPYRPHGDVLNAMALGELLRVLHENLHKDDLD